MPFSEEMRQLLTANNFQFLFNGLKLTLYISFVSIILSTIFGTILAVLRNQTHGPLKLLASIYVEVVRNIPNLLWIYVIFLIFKIKSTPAGIVSFTVFTTAALAEIIRGGLNGVDKGQIEAARSQGFSNWQILSYCFASSHSQCLTSNCFSVCYCHQGYKFLVFRDCFTRTLWQILYLNGALRTNRTSIHYLRNRRPNLFHY